MRRGKDEEMKDNIDSNLNYGLPEEEDSVSEDDSDDELPQSYTDDSESQQLTEDDEFVISSLNREYEELEGMLYINNVDVISHVVKTVSEKSDDSNIMDLSFDSSEMTEDSESQQITDDDELFVIWSLNQENGELERTVHINNADVISQGEDTGSEKNSKYKSTSDKNDNPE